MANRKISINRGAPEVTPPEHANQLDSTARTSSSFVVGLRVLLIGATVIGLLFLMATIVRYSQRPTQPPDIPDSVASEENAAASDVDNTSSANSETSNGMAASSGGDTGSEDLQESSGAGQNSGKPASNTTTPTRASSRHDNFPPAKVSNASKRRAVQQAVNKYQDETVSAGDKSVCFRILTHLRQEVRLLLILLDEDLSVETNDLVKAVLADLPRDGISWGWIPPASRCVTELSLALLYSRLGDAQARQLISKERQLLLNSELSFPECLYLHAEISARAWSAGADAVHGGSGSYASVNQRIEGAAKLSGLQHASTSVAISLEALINYVGQGAGVESVCRSALARRNQATTALGRTECSLEARARVLSLAKF